MIGVKYTVKMADWIIVVDDDPANLKIAGRLLSEHGMRVTALRSGAKFLEYVRENGTPDIVLLDILMPGMDGFRTLTALRELEAESGYKETPVIFLSADDDRESEMRGFQMGVSDFVHKPFDPDILIQRISNVIEGNRRLITAEEEVAKDSFTGLLNKEHSREQISAMCRNMSGSLCMIDLDSFKLVNDIYGHEMGDRVLLSFTDIIKKHMTSDSLCGRIGGDEFLMFGTGMQREEDISAFTKAINDELLAESLKLMGEDMQIPIGASVGAVSVPQQGTDYDELFNMADKALYKAKENGKHGYALYKASHEGGLGGDEERILDLKTVTKLLEERNIPQSVMWMGREAFGNVYRYMMRYFDRYGIDAVKVLLTLRFDTKVPDKADHERIVDAFREVIQTSLRNSDIMVQTGTNQFFLLLPELSTENVDHVLERIREFWNRSPGHYEHSTILCEYEPVTSDV